jgi:hypothetical protein
MQPRARAQEGKVASGPSALVRLPMSGRTGLTGQCLARVAG